jgi:hypothetical protein
MPFLIQRINRRYSYHNKEVVMPQPTDSIDKIFEMDYMGSAEFEHGAVSSSYRLLLSLETSVREVELTRNGVTRTVYFVASDDIEAYEDLAYSGVRTFDQYIERFKTWLQQPWLRSKEITNFDILFEDAIPSYMQKYPPRVVAWWDLDENIAWTLDKDVADDLLQAFTVQPQTVPVS